MSKHNNFSAHRPSKTTNAVLIFNTYIGADLGLSLTGMRIGPLDPSTHKPMVGTRPEVVRPESSYHIKQQELHKVIWNLASNISKRVARDTLEVSRSWRSSASQSKRRGHFMMICTTTMTMITMVRRIRVRAGTHWYPKTRYFNSSTLDRQTRA